MVRKVASFLNNALHYPVLSIKEPIIADTVRDRVVCFLGFGSFETAYKRKTYEDIYRVLHKVKLSATCLQSGERIAESLWCGGGATGFLRRGL